MSEQGEADSKRATMKRFVAGLAVLGVLGLSAPGYGQMGMMGQGPMMGQGSMMMNMSMVRHHFVMMNGIDPRYVSKENRLQTSSENIKNGRKLYEQNCAACHGATGLGDGEAGKSLSPRPANIAAFSKTPMASDGYIYWTIAEGGVPVGSAMPPFKGQLKDEEIWKIITYLRVL